MLIFGDSWARSPHGHLRTWPELLADQLDWACANVAIPGGDSSKLGMQLDMLQSMLVDSGAMIHEDAFALIHAGGNDLMRAISGDFLGFAGVASCNAACCLSPCCCRIGVFDEVADNVEELMIRLDEDLGIRNIIVVGLPLTPSLPFIAQLIKIFETRLCLGCVANYVLRRLNSTYNRVLARRFQRYHKFCDTSAGMTLMMDEAAAIDACSKNQESGAAMWNDGIHPTQAGHEALAEEMYARFQVLSDSHGLASMLDLGTESEDEDYLE
jgi:lysophospholipase L1-like esterase